MRSENIYQTILISFGVIAAILLGLFLYREVFPEYKIYQNAYIELEKFRSSYTGEPPPDFRVGVKQIVLTRDDKGPETIDRCISCHVALDLEHFSPTKIARDINGNIIIDAEGIPEKIPNENYIWDKLEKKIAALTDPEVIEHLKESGEKDQIKERLAEAKRLSELKVAHVGPYEYEMDVVLAMHPLIGKETRPFEFHSMDTFGCTSCHSGNGRGLVTDRAHGPVFDDFYDEEYEGPEPKFLESDPENDPKFSKVFNHKPGPRLLFQTSPILVGDLIQARCVQCHQPTSAELQNALGGVENIKTKKIKQTLLLKKALRQDLQSLQTLLEIKKELKDHAYPELIQLLKNKGTNNGLTTQKLDQIQNQLSYIQKNAGTNEFLDLDRMKRNVLTEIDRDIVILAGTPESADDLVKNIPQEDSDQLWEKFLVEQRQNNHPILGSIFAKIAALNFEQEIVKHVDLAQSPLSNVVANDDIVSKMTTDIDVLTQTYQKGEALYISQACYACHRIAGFARGGVGPELTREGLSYPWFVKQSIVWPQADLKTSTMPNMKLDHEELEALMTFLMAQRGESKAISGFAYQSELKAWEEGKKKSFEKPLTPVEIQDVRLAMEIFAVQGCAGCHRLKGFESDVGFRIESQEPSFDQLYREHQWFQRLFPEDLLGSQIVETLDHYSSDIDQHIVSNIRQGSILEEIELKHPQSLEALYSNFKFAERAKNHEWEEKAKKEKDPAKKAEILGHLKEWKERIHRVLMMYIQEYGLGRLIGPRPNWSGIFRSNEWLMEHFWNPQSHVPRSIMPVFPFDDTKFQALTHMLDVLAQKNRDAERMLWKERGFSPEIAVNTHCAQCHGPYLQGNGPVAEWIYPIPKNLKNAFFLRNLTKERAIQSIVHGVKGTPMPPWGEVASDKDFADSTPVFTQEEIEQIVNWLFANIPGHFESIPNSSQDDVLKWHYQPSDVIKELRKEGNLKNLKEEKVPQEPPQSKASPTLPPELADLPQGEHYYAALNPVVSTDSEEDIFDVKPALISGPEKNFYYIKKKYYTNENLKEGEKFFLVNCAVCHGNEADGAGLRAAAMQDAKPRMLTNLDWLAYRDDLRLLRSIKYGVSGTAMTPWGDLTSGLQRLQLVMYIRNLSSQHRQQEELMSQLYQSFTSLMITIENARINEFQALQNLENEYQQIHMKRELNTGQNRNLSSNNQEIMSTYQKELELLGKLEKARHYDQLFVSLKNLVKQEREISQILGTQLVIAFGESSVLQDYFDYLKLNIDFIKYQDSKLKVFDEQDEKMSRIYQNINSYIQSKIDNLDAQKKLWTGKIPSDEKNHKLKEIDQEISDDQKIKKLLQTSLAEIERIKNEEKAIVLKIESKENNESLK